MIITIDGKKVKSKQDLHDELRRQLSLPDYYGDNLDSLDECLDDYDDLTVNFINTSELVYNLEKYFFILLDVLKDHEVNVNIKVEE